jgi:protein translocase SecG subunit
MSVLGLLLPWLQAATAILLVGAILLQRGDEGLGSAFGGPIGGVFFAKRGMEKGLFIFTIVLAVIFLIINVLALFI